MKRGKIMKKSIFIAAAIIFINTVAGFAQTSAVTLDTILTESQKKSEFYRETFKNLAEELRSQYTITYQPTNTAKDGKWRAIEIKTNKPDLNVRTRKGYNAPKEK